MSRPFRLLVLVPILVAALSAISRTQPVTIGEISLPLGQDAFAADVQCVGVRPTCGGEWNYLRYSPTVPNWQFLPATGGLTGEYLYEVVISDLNHEDDILLLFDPPIQNQPGADLYLAQARYIAGNGLGLFNQSLNELQFRTREMISWQTLEEAAFQRDLVDPGHIVISNDPPGWDPVGTPYEIWYHLVDLTDLGYEPCASIREVHVRGPQVPSWPETAGLDVVAVANMNRRRSTMTSFPLDGVAVLPRLGGIAGTTPLPWWNPCDMIPPEGYHVSGRVEGPAGQGVSGVVLTAAGPVLASTLSLHGDYSFLELQGGIYTLTPAKLHHLFDPASVHLVVSNADVLVTDITAYDLGGDPDGEFEGPIVAIDAASLRFTVQTGNGPLQLRAHVAAAYEGLASSFGELAIGMKAKGDRFTAGNLAVRIKTEEG